MKRILTESEAWEICKWLKIINSPIKFIMANPHRFCRLWDILRSKSTDFDLAYRRDKINYCYSPVWEPGR